MKIQFRSLDENDFSQIHIWRNTDFVKQYWTPVTLEEIKKKYKSYITGEKPTKAYIIVIDGNDVGYIQTYYYSNYKGVENSHEREYYDSLDANKYSAGIDLFIGNNDYVHKGYVFSDPNTVNIIITPNPDNIIAIKAHANNIHMVQLALGIANSAFFAHKAHIEICANIICPL